MAPSASPLRLQVIDRFVTVLQAIVTGSDYWLTPGHVVKRWIGPQEAKGYPVYGVFPGQGSTPDEDSGEYREEFQIVVKGVVKSHADTVTEMEHALADVRKAIDRDSRLGTAGTLGAMTVYVRVGESATDEGEFVSAGLGFFEQRFIVQIAGNPYAES